MPKLFLFFLSWSATSASSRTSMFPGHGLERDCLLQVSRPVPSRLIQIGRCGHQSDSLNYFGRQTTVNLHSISGHFSNQSVNVSCLKQVSLFFSPGAGCDGKGDQQPPFAAWLRNSRFAMSSWVVTRVSSGPRILLYSYLQGQAAGSSSSSLPGLSFSTSHWAPVSGWWMLPMPCELLKATVSQCELPKCLIVFDCYRYAIDVYWCYIRCFYLFLVVSVGPGLALLLVLLQCLNIQFYRWPSSILQPMSLPHFTLLIQRHE